MNSPASWRSLRPSVQFPLRSPIPHAPIAMEHPLQNLLLERMFLYFGFVDRDAQAGAGVGFDETALFLDGEAFLDHVLPPGDVGVDRFSNDVARLREPKLQRGGRADGALRVVRSEGDAVGFRQGGDPAGFAEAAAMRDVELTDIAGPGIEQIAERRQVRHPLARRDRRGDGCIDLG